MDPDTEHADISAAKGGDRDAFDRLARLHGPALVRKARHIVSDAHLAHDLAQEALLRAFTSMRHLAEGKSFKAWIVRIARNVALDRVRHSYRHQEHELHEPELHCEPPPPERAVDAQSRPDLFRLRTLSPEDQQLLVLRHLKGLGLEEIGRETGLPRHIVKMRLYRARERLVET